MARYTNADELMLEIDSEIRIAKSKYRELDPNDVIYNPKLTKSKDYYDGIIDAFHMAQARIIANMLTTDAPTADVREVVHGHWERLENGSDWRPVCHENDIGLSKYKFCPFCGADMRGEKDG